VPKLQAFGDKKRSYKHGIKKEVEEIIEPKDIFVGKKDAR
jgi:hypothetical protein